MPLALALYRLEQGLEELEPEAQSALVWDTLAARTPVATAPVTVADNTAAVPRMFVDMLVDRLADTLVGTAARSCIAAPDDTVERSCIVAPSPGSCAGSYKAAELTAWADTQPASAEHRRTGHRVLVTTPRRGNPYH